MTTTSTAMPFRFATGLTAAMIIAGGVAAGTTSPAHAAAARQAGGGTVKLQPSDAFTIPTWIAGKTEVCVINGADGAGKLRVRSQSGADPEYIEVQTLLQSRCISRWWAGIPVDLSNEGSTVLAVSYR